MANSIMIEILKIVRSKRGCSLQDLIAAIPEGYFHTDADNVLDKPIQTLIEWGLIEVFDERGNLQKTYPVPSTGFSLRRKELTFFLSLQAAEMEEALGFSFKGIPQSVFGEPQHSPRGRNSWPLLFMLMPFTQELTPIFEDHVKKVAFEIGLTAARADDFFSSNFIINEIYSSIVNAEIIVADCTGRNPNVFYEIGIAHTMGKETILISQSIYDVPFDLRHLRVITYQYTPRGMQEFEKTLRKFLVANRTLFVRYEDRA